MDGRPLPLDGIRVLDLSQILAGPYCTMMLGDLGADVVKVERPGGGDGSRQWGPPFVGDESVYYLQVNRSKRSITIDLKDPEDVAVARRLADQADVVIENFLPGAAARYGLDHATVKQTNPGVVSCAIRGYPHDHPNAARPGYDFLMQGIGGIMSMQGEPDGPPMKVAVAIADIVAGLFAGNAILAALVERATTGTGRDLEVSLLDSQVAWLANRAGDWLIGGIEPERLGNAHPSIVPYETFRGRRRLRQPCDRKRRSVPCASAVEAGRVTWPTTPRFQTNRSRVIERERAGRRATATIATRTVAEHWIAILDRAAAPGGPVLTLPQVFDGPAAHMVETVEHPTAGPLRLVRSPIGIDGERPSARRASSTARRAHRRGARRRPATARTRFRTCSPVRVPPE